jgi:hypothetical protein
MSVAFVVLRETQQAYLKYSPTLAYMSFGDIVPNTWRGEVRFFRES